MSVDKTISELSNTLSQLSTLVEQINSQLSGITTRINITLDNFDNSVTGIASDAGAASQQVGDTISQIPNSWIFYLLFITLIIVLILLSVLIVINLGTKIHAIYKIFRPDAAQPTSTMPFTYSSPKSTLDSHIGLTPGSNRLRSKHMTMENEPRRFGYIPQQTNVNSPQNDHLIEINKENNSNEQILQNGYLKSDIHYNNIDTNIEPYLRKTKLKTTMPSSDFQYILNGQYDANIEPPNRISYAYNLSTTDNIV